MDANVRATYRNNKLFMSVLCVVNSYKKDSKVGEAPVKYSLPDGSILSRA